MNIEDNKETNACGFSDLQPGNVYWKVCCGSVQEIVFANDLDGIKFEYVYYCDIFKLFNTIDTYYSDSGIWDAPVSYYKNLLNRIFKTEEDALRYIQSDQYQYEMKRHNELIKDFLQLEIEMDI